MLSDHHLELTEAGDGAWRVCDTRVPEAGASHIVASIEARDQDFEVLWIRGAVDAPGPFRDLESALGVIDEIVAARTEERFAAPVAPVPARDDEALMRPATPARAPFAAG